MLNRKYIELIKEKICSVDNKIRQAESLAELTSCLADKRNTFCTSYDNFGVIGDTIISYDGNKSTVKVPASIRGQEIKRIGRGAFCGNSTIRILEIEEGIEQIGDMAFYECANIVHISFPSTIKVVGKNAFNPELKPDDITVNLLLEKTEYLQLLQSGIETTDGSILIDQSLLEHYEIEKRYNLEGMKYPRPYMISAEMGALFIGRRNFWNTICFKGYTAIQNEMDGVAKIINEKRICPIVEKAERYSDRNLYNGYRIHPVCFRLAFLDESRTVVSYGTYRLSIRFIIRGIFFQSVEKIVVNGKIYYVYSRNYLTSNTGIPYLKVFKEILKNGEELPDSAEKELVYRKYRLIADLG